MEVDIQELKEKLKQAITGHKVIEIVFKEQTDIRKVQPYHFGTNRDDEQLHGFQIAGPSSNRPPVGWRHFPLADIKKINVTDQT